MAGKAVPNFVASRDTLPFANDWPSQPDLVIKLPVAGTLKIGDASKGLCGGMVYAVRDFYEAGIPVPAGPQPTAGMPLYRYIVRRLFDSFDIPGGVVKYYTWMNTPEADQPLGARTRRGIAWRTINREWPQIRDDIDAGHPSPLGLVTVRSVNPMDLGRCHQVLAYAYDLEGSAGSYLVRKKPRIGSAMPTLWVIEAVSEGRPRSRERLQLSAPAGSVLGS